MFINRGSNYFTGLTSGRISFLTSRLLGQRPDRHEVNKEANGEDPVDLDLDPVRHRLVR